jgi:archaellum biogenesis protein FlaJ (TadC family)
LSEHEIDAELFWGLEEGQFNDMLGVTEVYGDRKRFHEKIAKIKKDWEDKKEKEYKESKKVNTDGIRNMLTKLATSDVKGVEMDCYQCSGH